MEFTLTNEIFENQVRKIKFKILGDVIAKKRPRFFSKHIRGKIIQGVYSEQRIEE